GGDLERVAGGGQLVTAPAGERLALGDRDRGVAGQQVAGLQVRPRRVTLPHPDLAGEDQRLGPWQRLREHAVDEELVEALSGRLAADVPRSGRAHPRIVAHAASPRITGEGSAATGFTVHVSRASTTSGTPRLDFWTISHGSGTWIELGGG